MSTARWLLRGRAVLLTAMLAMAATLAVAHPAHADFGLSSFSASFQTPAGDPVTQAGAHPDLTLDFGFRTALDPVSGQQLPDGQVKDLAVDLPAGFYGNPQAVQTCRMAQLVAQQGLCNTDAQVGVVRIKLGPNPSDTFNLPIYNMATSDNETATLGFMVIGGTILVRITARGDGNYALRSTVSNINQVALLYQTTLRLWGVPADPSHDADRNVSFGPGGPTGLAPRPFLTMPARCQPATFGVRVRSWQGGPWLSAFQTTVPLTGCDSLQFQPTLTADPGIRAASAPTGLDVSLRVPQDDSVSGLATPQLRKVELDLPAGVAISPPSASGLGACSDAELALGSDADATCPDASKLGTVSITTPLLATPLTGDVVLGTPQPGRLFRLFIVARGPGLVIKLPGIAVPDPATGALTATFDDTPQLPFSDMTLHLKSGPRAALRTPTACGTYVTTARMTPWAPDDAAPVTSTSSFTIDQGCARAGRFEPSLDAGLTDAAAGRSASFVLDLARPDGEQGLGALDVTLPRGLLARVGSVPLCPEPQAAAGTCAPSSQVGTTSVAAGSGPAPIYLPQPGKTPTAVYLAGPYAGAPYSLSIVVPAQAGPFDLGTVVVRAALFVDPTDAHVTIRSDPLPTILRGIPLDLRRVVVTVDRPGFMVTPTSCTATAVTAQVRSVAGATAFVQSPFQATGCAKLPFAPRLGLALSGKGQNTDGRHPALVATLAQRRQDANPKGVKVTLPASLALDPANSRHVCDYDAARAVHGGAVPCPASTRVGTASVVTPLLSKPLTGSVYLVQGVRFSRSGARIRTLPTLLIPLRGDVALDLRASTEVDGHGRLVTAFSSIPDAPVTSFRLAITGGSKGILVVTDHQDVCHGTQTAATVMDAQSGRRVAKDVTVRPPCARRASARGRKAR
jgi:hypothetical protein